MIAKARAAETKKLEMERLKIEQLRQTSMSPHEKLIQERLRQQERLREDQLLEEAQIRQEKLNLIRQEETLLMRQEEMLRQIQEEKMKLLKQEDMIRSRQQDRLTQVRSEKALLEKQETMLKLREEQLLQERKRQERLREEAIILKRQEEEIRRRQEEIAKELLKGADDVMVCQAREGQVYMGRKPHFQDTVLDMSVVDVQQLASSDWSSSDAESFMPPKESKNLKKSHQDLTSYMEPNENYDSNPFTILNPEDGEIKSGSSDETDTIEEDCYECKVEVKQQNTQVPTSVRTIETVIDVPGWAPVTPYLNVSEHLPISREMSLSFSKSDSHQYKNAGIVTSPESVITSTNMMTTPDSSISLQSQLSNNDFSSCPPSPLPPVPPLPKDSNSLMPQHFQTVQPEVPKREDSFNVTAVYSSDALSMFTDQTITSQAPGQRKSLIETNYITIPSNIHPDPQLSPRLGGPGSAFRPYASSENLFDPSLFPSSKPPVSSQNGHSSEKTKRHSTASMKPSKFVESDDDFFKPRAQKHLRAPIMSTTDTEPEMKEFNLGPIGGEKKGKKHQKAFYSTSETEEEYQAYLKSKPKWHSKGGHKDSWDPLQIASPPQIVQKPVGVVQKPKPQAKQVARIERGMEYSAAFAGNMLDQQFDESYINTQMNPFQPNNSLAVPESLERIQKSDSIIELRQKGNLIPSGDRIQKSNSVIEVIPSPLKIAHNHANESTNQYTQINNNNNQHMMVNKASMLQVPQVSSPPDSEDQTTPQAPRRQFLPNQMSIDSMNSLSEPEEANENLAPQLKSNREDPETKKKKEIHKNLMSEALKKVELRTNQKKNFSQLSRTNPTLAALDIVTRKELKMEEMENNKEQEILRNRNRSGSTKAEDINKNVTGAGVNQNVLQNFRKQSLLKFPSLNQTSFATEADSRTKMSSAQPKPELLPKPDTQSSQSEPEPVVVLKRQPRILDKNEIQARQSMERQRLEGKSTPTIEMRSRVLSPENNEVSVLKNFENIQGKNIGDDLRNKNIVINDSEEMSTLKKSPNKKESSVVKANEKISAAQQKLQNSEQRQSVKQVLQGVIQVRPKNTESLKVAAEQENKVVDNQEALKKTPNEENNNKIASVRKAAEKYENKNVQSDSSTNLSSHLRLRSKSISNSRKDQFEEGSGPKKTKTNLPWAVKSPPVLRKRDAGKNKGYALQMSKSSDSITAAKLLARARAENNNNSGLRINQNFSKSIEKQIDVYSKTKEEIRMILSLAKSGSVNDRIALFSNLVNTDAPRPNPQAKAESIRREIEEARAKAHETVSDTEIEFQEPIESRVKPLKLPMKPKLVDTADVTDESVIQQLETMPKPILKNHEKERSRSPRKKTPKLVSDHFLTPDQSFQIYAQSATDMSATEDEADVLRVNFGQRKKSVPARLPSQDPGPDLLRVPSKDALDRRPGIMKSKSFGSCGQFEGSIEQDLVTAKKLTMMSFFNSNEVKPKSIMKQTNRSNRRNSVSSITDEVLAEEDLIDIDAEFENLLTATFEQESKSASGQDVRDVRFTTAGQQSAKAKGIGSAGVQAQPMQHSVRKGNDISNDLRLVGKTSKLKKSQSFSAEAVGHSSEHSVVHSDMQQINEHIKQGFDPVAALPSSTNRHQRKNFGTPQHSPSPTQSEYDTADPWDDY